MAVRVRRGTETDAEGMSRVHFEAVRQTAAAFYPSELIKSWTHTPDDTRQEQFRRAIAARLRRGCMSFVPFTSTHVLVAAGLVAASSRNSSAWPSPTAFLRFTWIHR